MLSTGSAFPHWRQKSSSSGRSSKRSDPAGFPLNGVVIGVLPLVPAVVALHLEAGRRAIETVPLGELPAADDAARALLQHHAELHILGLALLPGRPACPDHVESGGDDLGGRGICIGPGPAAKAETGAHFMPA